MTWWCRVCGRVRSSLFAVNHPRPQQLWVGHVFQATAGERRITALLTEKLSPTYLEVRDISGGCGSMYEIVIDSEQFDGKRLLQQHRLVNEALGEEVQSLHGMTIRIGNPRTKG